MRNFALAGRCWRRCLPSSSSTVAFSSLGPALRLQRSPASHTQRRSILFKMGNETPTRIVGYYIIFPVIPDETVENNVFVSGIARNEDWPRLSTATPREMYEGTVRMLMEYGATTLEHLEHLKAVADVPPAEIEGEASADSFEKVIDPLLTEEYEVDYAFNTLLLKMLTDWPDGSRKLFDADLHHIKIMCARDRMEKLTDETFQAAIKKLYDRRDQLNEWQFRLLEWYLLEVRASGLDRHDEKTRKLIGSWSRFIDEYRTKYISNAMNTNDQNVFPVTERSALKDAPPHVLQTLSQNRSKWSSGPWRARMMPASILPFMQYCADRPLRATAWEKWISKASFEHDFYNNSINVEEIRHNNEGMAKALGYASVAEHRLANKMAGSPETVRNFLDALGRRIRPVFIDRIESWSAFAQAKELHSGDLQVHDLFYICRREAEAHYDVNGLDLMNHFPFWPTTKKVFGILSLILGVRFKNVTNGLERCHNDVRVYAVSDTNTGEHLGRLYIDPYDRENKRGGWNTLLGRNTSKERGLDKIVYLIGEAIAPTETTPSLLHYQQLQQLLFQIGRALQLLCSRSPYRDVTIPWAPYYASDWDAADLLPQFVASFIYKPNLLLSLASPHELSKEVLTEERGNAISLTLARSTFWESYRTLFWADFDLSIYEMEDRKKKFWLDMYRELYKEYFPFRMLKSDYQPCSFIPVFGIQPHMAMYYRKLWTEMLALDVHETFDIERDVKKTGARLRSTILDRGASDVAKELYRRFQGRDPSVGAICDFYDPPSFYNIEESASQAVNGKD